MGQRMVGMSAIEKSEENEVHSQISGKLKIQSIMQINHQKICMTVSGHNQMLVIKDHFIKLAEAEPC